MEKIYPKFILAILVTLIAGVFIPRGLTVAIVIALTLTMIFIMCGVGWIMEVDVFCIDVFEAPHFQWDIDFLHRNWGRFVKTDRYDAEAYEYDNSVIFKDLTGTYHLLRRGRAALPVRYQAIMKYYFELIKTHNDARNNGK